MNEEHVKTADVEKGGGHRNNGNNGVVKEWNDGIMEYWNIGKMEVWKSYRTRNGGLGFRGWRVKTRERKI